MTQLSNYAENELADHIVGKGTYTPPATYYLSLHTANPAEDASGTEVSGGSYARKSFVAADIEDAASQATQNANAITFAEATGAWGTVTHFAVWDASSSGNMLIYGALGSSIAPTSGFEVSFAAGELDFTANLTSDYMGNSILDHLFGKATFAALTNMYVALSTTTATSAGGSVTEPSGNGYARALFTETSLAAPSDGSLVSDTDISFAPATGSWGTITDFLVYDALSGGNVIFRGVFASSFAPVNGTTVTISSGNLTWTLA